MDENPYQAPQAVSADRRERKRRRSAVWDWMILSFELAVMAVWLWWLVRPTVF
jgi:hypothetical protein